MYDGKTATAAVAIRMLGNRPALTVATLGEGR